MYMSTAYARKLQELACKDIDEAKAQSANIEVMLKNNGVDGLGIKLRRHLEIIPSQGVWIVNWYQELKHLKCGQVSEFIFCINSFLSASALFFLQGQSRGIHVFCFIVP